jgi:hypothetical protein
MGRSRKPADLIVDEDRSRDASRQPGSAEADLIAICAGLGARRVCGWSRAEEILARNVAGAPRKQLAELRERIAAGEDPLGAMFCRLRSAAVRRSAGAVYTPLGIADTMLDWAQAHATPDRVIDGGVGSGRFLVGAGRRFERTNLIGVAADPLAAMLARAHLAAAGLTDRSEVLVGDYRDAPIREIAGRTLFIGNPPYVRHHLIEPRWKTWFVSAAIRMGLAASQLAGLHAHFFLATALKARPGDFGAFITAAEWLDVNYGSLVRALFLADLGGQSITVIEPTAMPFPDAASTAVITTFVVGSGEKSVVLRRVTTLEELRSKGGERVVRRACLHTERRWSHLTRPARKRPAGYTELGEICRVHRGQVTGANHVWIAGSQNEGLPESTLFPSVTKARELFAAGRELTDATRLRRVIDLPVDLDVFDELERQAVDRHLATARSLGVDKGYVASRRKAWWSVGLRKPAPILASYMARRPPAFVHNRAGARHINIAHGLYPREPFEDVILRNLVEYLSTATSTRDGRTYAGGLTKFEPGEMERILVPDIEILRRPAREAVGVVVS